MASRRLFLQSLAAAVAGAAFDPSALLHRKYFDFGARPHLASGWLDHAAGMLRKGDVITISGIYQVNPAGIYTLQHFVIGNEVISDPARFPPLAAKLPRDVRVKPMDMLYGKALRSR